jgi:hypothetical protein
MNNTIKKEEVVNNSNQPQNQKPFDVVMNEHFVQYQSKGFSRNWFIPIVKEQSEMDRLISIKSQKQDSWGVNWDLGNKFPNTLLEVNKDDEGNPISIYVLYSKGGKLYRVVSQKDYGVIKSRMELKNGKYVPYEKCDLVPFDGKVEEWDYTRLVKSISYKNGVKDGECFSYYVDGTNRRNEETNKWEKDYYYEKTTFKNGKKNGEYENTKNGTKGNYDCGVKVGEWKISNVEFQKDIVSKFESEYGDKYNSELNEFLHKELVFNYSKYLNRRTYWWKKPKGEELDSKLNITVNYDDGNLNGKFQILKGDVSYHYSRTKGNIKNGLIDGELYTTDEECNYPLKTTDISSCKIYYPNNGIINGTYLKWESEKKNELTGKELETIQISNYKDFEKWGDEYKLQSNFYNEIPKKIQSLVKEDDFQNCMRWLGDVNCVYFDKEEFVVTEVNFWDKKTDRFHSEYQSKKSDIKIEYVNMNYGLLEDVDEDKMLEILMEDYGFKSERGSNGFLKIPEEYQYDGSKEFYYPKVWEIKMNEKIYYFIDGKIIEYDKNDIDDVLLNHQKEILQNLSNSINESLRLEEKIKLMKEKEREEKKEKERLELGVSLSSFPVD